MIIRYLYITKYRHCSLAKASIRRCLGVSCGVVLQAACKLLKPDKYLIISVLNSIYVVADVMKYGYLCKAKVPYYGRSTYRHRAYGYASPVRDVAGTRGSIGTGWRIV